MPASRTSEAYRAQETPPNDRRRAEFCIWVSVSRFRELSRSASLSGREQNRPNTQPKECAQSMASFISDKLRFLKNDTGKTDTPQKDLCLFICVVAKRKVTSSSLRPLHLSASLKPFPTMPCGGAT